MNMEDVIRKLTEDWNLIEKTCSPERFRPSDDLIEVSKNIERAIAKDDWHAIQRWALWAAKNSYALLKTQMLITDAIKSKVSLIEEQADQDWIVDQTYVNPDGLIRVLHDWVMARESEFSIEDAVNEGLRLDLTESPLTRDLRTRVGLALRKLGCQKFERRNSPVRFWYQPPAKKSET